MNPSRLNQILPLKSSALWKGVGLGAVACVLLLLAVGVPSLMTARKYSSMALENETRISQTAGYVDVVQADAPKIIHKAELALQVTNCAETQKKIEALAADEGGFLESSTLEENSAEIKLRVPSARFDEVRGKLRDLAVRVRQDSISAADVSKQYVDREARLRNMRAQEQQFLEIMKKAHTVPDVLAVSKELDQVRGEIERADAEFRHLKDQIDMAQFTIRLFSEASPTRWTPRATAKSAVHDLVESLASLGDFLIWLVVNLPVLVLWIVTVLLLAAFCWYILRKAWRFLRALFGKKAPAP
jgi:Domain of unknown function (DUF4349)